MESNRPLVGPEVESLIERARALVEQANEELAAQAISPGDVEAWLECYVGYAEVQRLVNEAIVSILRSHPELSDPRVPR